MIRTYSIVTFFLLLFAATSVFAQKPDMEQAKVIFQEAEGLAAEKRYVASAEKYLEAYNLFPASDFLFNAAEMYRYAGKKQKAVDNYKAYIAADPAGRGAKESKSALSTLESELLEEQAKEDEAKKAQALEEEKRKKELELEKTTEPKPAKPETHEPSTGNTMRLVGIAGMSIGAMGLVVGGYYGLEARSLEKKVEDSSIYLKETEAQGRAAESRALLFSVGGAVVLAGGAVTYFFLGKDSKDSSVSLFPTVSGDAIGAMAVGQF